MSLRRPTVAFWLFTFDISPFCGVALTPDCGTFILFYLSRRRSRHPIGLPLFIYLATLIELLTCALLLLCIMFAFVISYVQTVLRVHSKYSPGLLIWPDVDEGDLMDEEFDSESDA